ncbi:MAG: hypothetical protein COU51_02435 [Parcubacteria group bacterium CG10_big_fil_rev_8_21_14_0_10_36_14]|nr:MAG: hypothetical protein COU51_02435 [Parcubacteria group bacterium CG10_big_fil_rev_8_21_14_0_10_36_14]
MQRKYRKIIFFVFAVFFIISIPIILLYTGGYRYNIKKNRLEKTGNLVVNTKTKGVTLYLNERRFENKEEFRIQNILPGEYLIKIIKEGYFDWQKKLAIESEITTFIKDVRLFKQSLPINVIDKNTSTLFYSPNGKFFITDVYLQESNNYQIIIFNTETEIYEKLALSTKPLVDTVWSGDSNKFVIKTFSDYQLFDINREKIELPKITNIKKIKWDEKNGMVLYAENDKGIYKIDALFNTSNLLYPLIKTIDDFNISGNYLYITESFSLKQINLKDSTDIITIPLERKNYVIKDLINKKIFLLNQGNKLQVFDLPLNQLSTPILMANAKDFNLSGNSLLYYDNFELWTHNFDGGEKTLITRIGENIKKARWLNGSEYIIFILENKLEIIEMDKRDQRQTIGIIKFDDINDMLITKNFNIYFTGQLQNSKGLFKLEI